MELTQQTLLRTAMQKLSFSRDKFANLLGISRRRLDSWLLPKGSSGFRTMTIDLQTVIFNKIREFELQERELNPGTLSLLVPTILSDTFDFDFPTLYRVKYLCTGFAETGEDDPSRNTFHFSYTLSDSPLLRGLAVNNHFVEAEPVQFRNTEFDTGRVIIAEHRTLERADAFIRAMLLVQPFISPYIGFTTPFYTYNGRIFTLTHLPCPVVATSYQSDFYLHKRTILPDTPVAFSLTDENGWEIDLDASGKELPYDWLDNLY
jgi:hypothetical protein